MANELTRSRLRKVLHAWRDDLVDLTGRNRLLNFRHTRTATLAIRHPPVDQLLDGLDSGWRFASLPEESDQESESGADEPPFTSILETGGLLSQKSTQPQLNSSLRKLYRDSNQVFNDTGLWTLQLGVGFLEWREPGAENSSASPLLLVPVRLDRLGPGIYRLITEAGEDGTPNPALAVKMAQLGLSWPAADDMKDLPSTLALVRRAIAGQPGWEITEDVVLANFRSHKEAMYRDLLDHEDSILAHPMVRAIGLGAQSELPDDALYFEPADPDRIDDLQPPEETPLVLDADTSQRQCVAAALDGHSFVMDGPPGTGKSQTIANIIAALMHQGRSVLFVSEKAAALDVVRNRLDASGLGSFLLSLHSHHASRKEVATELGATMERRPRANRASSDGERRQLLRRRRVLSGYAAAMNESRPSLNRSLHEVIGRVSTLADVPLLPTGLPTGLNAMSLQEILSAAGTVGDNWRPVVEEARFPWHGLIAATPSVSPHARLRIVMERAGALRRRLGQHADLTGPLALSEPRDTERVLTLLDAAGNRPRLPIEWLIEPDLAALRAAVDDFAVRQRNLNETIARVEAEVGADWHRLPAGLKSTTPADEEDLPRLNPEGLSLLDLTGALARRLAGDFESTAVMLRQARASLGDIAAAYGMPTPTTLQEAFALCALTEFGRARSRPEAAWLTARGRAAATHAIAELEARFSSLAHARAAAGEIFTDRILTVEDFPSLARRFSEVQGLGKLSGTHRADKRMLGALTVKGEWGKAAAARLPSAIAWYEADKALRHAISMRAQALGRYWQGEHTDFHLVRGLLNSAENIAQSAVGVEDSAALVQQVTAGGHPDLTVCDLAAEWRTRLGAWQATLVPAPRLGGRTRLGHVALPEVISWYEAHLSPLKAASDLTEAVGGVSEGSQEPTLAQARRIIEMVNGLRAQVESFKARAGEDKALMRTHYVGLETDVAKVRHALGWVVSVRSDGEAMPEQAAAALLGARPDEELRKTWAAYRTAVTDFVQLFESARQHPLRELLTGTFTEFEEETVRMSADESGPTEWQSFVQARTTLRRHGLADLIDRAADQDLEGAIFGKVVERAVLEAWIEDTLATDSRLVPVRAAEHDKLVAEFRDLDRALVENAHAQVIDACNARRPRPGLGQAGIIRREAEKKSRHMPVRTLLEKTADIVPLIKPCFMMSPLTVSQFLPPGYRFDVVIFDEASQVLPQDAVNCIYRGDALIVAGDQKQLPPTDFFSHSEEDDGDEYDEDIPDSFESLLGLSKASGLIKSLSLRWHYRSHHEGLIAFSNHFFYDDELVTFPGARESGNDVGVTFTKVDGVYERGRSRRNPLEADAVAERVLHHYTVRPHMSLGVVAMSDAQAQAIEDAVELARAQRPELDRFFSEDRLNGFFVKNLETVQGDERDVILISVGYGPDQHGKLTMNFGPLNLQNGWRRLNVAVTRARRRVEVISSISAAEIRESANRSRNYFKRYLDYAERGPLVFEDVRVSDDAAPESPFEESVLGVLQGWGYDVQPQVGVGAYRIDLALRDPEQPDRFILGIECDGAMYHSSKAARDRDRLRETVLRGLGWELHRIWGTDWYRHRNEAEQQLRMAVEAAFERARSKGDEQEPEGQTGDGHSIRADQVGAATPARSPEPVHVTMEAADPDRERDWAALYREARLPSPPSYLEPHQPEAREVIRAFFRQVVENEAPIQRELLYRRVADAWGVGRIGTRIRSNLDLALNQFVQLQSDIKLHEDTVSLAGRKVVARTPGDLQIRRIAEVPPVERKVALLGIIGESPGISADELTTLVARFFGWNRRGSDISRKLGSDLTDLSSDGRIEGLPHRIVQR